MATDNISTEAWIENWMVNNADSRGAISDLEPASKELAEAMVRSAAFDDIDIEDIREILGDEEEAIRTRLQDTFDPEIGYQP